jgi:hypothetical protein
MKTGRNSIGTLLLMVGVGVLGASMATAQTIPIPIYDDKEKRLVSVEVIRGLERTTSLDDPELRDARRRMNAGETISDEHLRGLAENRDGLAAIKYVERLVEKGVRENASDIAFFASTAVGTGRVWPLPEMIDAMRYIDPATEPEERIKRYIAVIYAHAWAGNSLALDAVIEFNGPGKLFGEMGNATRRRLEEQARLADNGRIELRLALKLLETESLTEREQDLVRGYLETVSKSEVLGMRAIALNLTGLLDEKYGAKDSAE